MASGLITNPTAVAGIGTAFAPAKVIELAANEVVEAHSKDIPQSAYWDHIEIRCTPTGATEIEALLCWDAAGDEIAAGPSEVAALAPAVTTVADSIVSLKVDGWFTAPSAQTAKQRVYLFLRTDAGTIDVDEGWVRLHWADGHTRQ